jgi:hypothetical protein
MVCWDFFTDTMGGWAFLQKVSGCFFIWLTKEACGIYPIDVFVNILKKMYCDTFHETKAQFLMLVVTH